MASSHLLRLGRVKGKNGVLEALKHNKRELQNERGTQSHIIASRSHLNYALHGDLTAQDIATHSKVQMLKAGIETPRSNCVMAVEIIFSLPIDRHSQDTRPFFSDCYEWTKQTFAGELLSFDVHLDESAPHGHALILPLIDGKMQGRDLIGNSGNLYRLINLFHRSVGVKHGLSRRDKKHLNQSERERLGRSVLNRLRGDSVQASAIWAWVRDAIMKDPEPCAQMLGVAVSPAPKKERHFVDIKRSKGKGAFLT
ncbi:MULTISPECIES: plasmid recombination protein [unclassified Methylophilus]|uniref:plasmid recombination protein n=1 Tax=unclassified Methylophilus TaxID=2630143 RepID=UPI0006F4DF3F|nr:MULTISPECIES: plasmid recombination protein [unclassified Methylophilus]KQT42231.1 hypothetical protein ASG34_05585 [Methylophilus sp. Leaf416]KQT56413.1 hypothetical protein ASG44_05560 [Methylophilus sp. Leaf459]